MKITPHLGFNGDCAQALKFYEKALGGKVVFSMTYGETPMAGQVPKDWGGKIIHATFAVGDQTFGAADAPPPHYQKAEGLSVTLDIPEPSEAERVYKALSEKAAEISMPLQETFWARRFGMLTDRFGIPWMINCGKPR